MQSIRQITVITAATAFALAALAGPTFAQKTDGKAKAQMTYEQAWTQCKKFVDAGVASWDQTSQRYSRGAACMKKFGYRI
jgi:hypothetical protein